LREECLWTGIVLMRGLLGVGETAYSTFKRTFGEFCMAKTMKNITKELVTKAFIYNMLLNL